MTRGGPHVIRKSHTAVSKRESRKRKASGEDKGRLQQQGKMEEFSIHPSPSPARVRSLIEHLLVPTGFWVILVENRWFRIIL